MAVLLGCAANQNAQMGRSEHLEANKALHPDRVSFADDIGVLITDIRTTWEGQFLKVHFDLINAERADTTYPVYQIEWLDRDGIVKEQTSWKPLKIVGNQKVRVTDMSTVPNIADYKITISKKED
jgi:hypothetical protein